jgi:hypothetical protein
MMKAFFVEITEILFQITENLPQNKRKNNLLRNTIINMHEILPGKRKLKVN